MPIKSRVFRRLLLSYLAILAIPMIAGYMSYRTSISVTQSVSIENGVTQLQKSKEMMERRMAEVEGFTRQLAINRDLNILMYEKNRDKQSNVYGIWKMMKDVLSFGQTNDFLQDYFVYLKNYNVVLTPGAAYFRPEHYYENYRYAEMTSEQWQTEVLGRTHRSELLPLAPLIANGTEKSVLTYMQSLPLDSFNGSSPAVVVVKIDGKAVADLLAGLTDRYGGWAHIADAEGRTIGVAGLGREEMERLVAEASFDNARVSQVYDDDLVITVRSEATGWIYRAGIPRHILLENANTIKSRTWTVTGIALLAGLVGGLLLSYRNSVPLNRLLGAVREQFGGYAPAGARNEYDFLHGNIAEMITRSRRLEAELHRQQPLVRDAFLKRLLAGEFRTPGEVDAAAAQADAGAGWDAGYAGAMQINGYAGIDSVDVLNELNAARLLLKQALLDAGMSPRMTDIGADKIAFLLPFEGERVRPAQEEVERMLSRIARQAFEEYRISVTMAMGHPYLAATEVGRAFEQARQALEQAVQLNRKEPVWFEELRTDTATYDYPMETEQRLIGTIRAGELAEAKRILRSIMERNTQSRELSVEMKHQFVGELKGTLLKLLDRITFLEPEPFENVKNRIVGIQAAESFERIQEELVGVMEALCGFVLTRKNESHLRLVEQIKLYVRTTYADADLTLYRVAEQVERPEKFISQLFKEVTGVNLSDHLEQIRMEHAAAMLKINKLTVDEIASRVGYNSSHSFRRAFKRVTGISPSAFRQSMAAD